MGAFSGPSGLTFTRIRQTVNQYLPGTVVIQSFGAASDGAGGYSEVWTPVTNGTVAGRFNIMNYGQVEVLALAEGVRVEYSIVLPYNAPIVVGNRILTGGTVNSGGTYTGTEPYQVRILQLEQSNIGFIKAYCNRDQ